jgi:hypothetical protein
METQTSLSLNPSPISESTFPLRKDRDEASLSDDNFGHEQHDVHHKTRRVNPQRLAIRLGPELVAEMEAHIYPGAKMPSFDVRKVFQDKYNVDRRHIYDYFHSRGAHAFYFLAVYTVFPITALGLRVAKEDRHTNLTRGRLAKAQALQKQDQEVWSRSRVCVQIDRT